MAKQLLLCWEELILKLSYKIIIMSKDREFNVEKCKKVFGDNVSFCVHSSEVEKYIESGASRDDIIPHNVTYPPSKIVNVMLEYCKDHNIKYFCYSDDDIIRFEYLVGKKARKYDEAKDIVKIIENAVMQLTDIDADFWQPSTSASIIRYPQEKPYVASLGIPSGFFIIKVKDDYFITPQEHLHSMNCDVGIVLKVLLRGRFGIQERRLCAYYSFQDNSGGLQSIRTDERIQQSLKNLQEMWGCNIKIVKNKKGNKVPKINVTRKAK